MHPDIVQVSTYRVIDMLHYLRKIRASSMSAADPGPALSCWPDNPFESLDAIGR